MTIDSTTIGEAARDRFAEWAPAVRSQEGLRSLPGSHRFTDKDIWPAPKCFGAADKSKLRLCATETARQSREDVFSHHRCQSVGQRLLAAGDSPPPPPWLTFLRVVPQMGNRGGQNRAGKTKNGGAAAMHRKDKLVNR
jgi:hypothetical protein